jgi:hypothetical protein
MDKQLNESSGNASALMASNSSLTPRIHPPVAVRVHDGLEVTIHVEYGPDGSIVVDIRRRCRDAHDSHLRRVPRNVSPRTPNRHGDQNRASPWGPFGPFGSLRIVNFQRLATAHHSTPSHLPRSERVWNFGNIPELDEASNSSPPTPPPTYEESPSMPRYEEQSDQTQPQLQNFPSPIR